MAASKPNPTPGQPPNGASIPSSSIPAGLELLQAHIFFRHGERTPVKQRLVHLGLPERFNLCSAGKEFAAGVINAPVEGTAIDGGAPSASTSTIVGDRQNRELMLLRRRVEEGKGTTSKPGHEHECYWGELTDLGRLSTLRLGKQLRALYVDKLGFLPRVLGPEDVDSVYFRATQVPRALESTQQVLHGFFPKQDARVVPTIYQRPIDDESLLPDQGCPTAKAFDRASKRGAAEKYNHTLEPLDGKLAKLVGVPVRIDSHPSANGVFDTIKASQAHGVPVPAAFEDSALSAVLEGAIVKEWFSSYASRQFTKLAMGRLFYELNTRFDDRTEGKSPLKLGLYGCHDTSISGILHALKVQDGRWPAFTAYVSFELFKQEGRGTPVAKAGWFASLFGGGAVTRPALDRDHFVRVKYNNAEVSIPACQPEGKHLPGSQGSVCTLEAFKDAVKDLQINSEDWAKACRLPLPADV